MQENQIGKIPLRRDRLPTPVLGVPGGSEGKESSLSAGDLGLIPGSGRSPAKGNSHPLQYSRLQISKDWGAWCTTVYGISKSWAQLREQHAFYKREGLDGLNFKCCPSISYYPEHLAIYISTCVHTHVHTHTHREAQSHWYTSSSQKLIFVEGYGLCSRLRHNLASTVRVRKRLRQGPLSALAALYYLSSKWTVDQEECKGRLGTRPVWTRPAGRGFQPCLFCIPRYTPERTRLWAQPTKVLEV